MCVYEALHCCTTFFSAEDYTFLISESANKRLNWGLKPHTTMKIIIPKQTKSLCVIMPPIPLPGKCSCSPKLLHCRFEIVCFQIECWFFVSNSFVCCSTRCCYTVKWLAKLYMLRMHAHRFSAYIPIVVPWCIIFLIIM